MHANVDPAETAKFDAHAGQWWDLRGPLRTLHEINPVRLAWVAGHVRLDGHGCSTWAAAAGFSAKPWRAPGRP